MKTDYTLTDEYLEAVQVNEGTWMGLDLGRALTPEAQQLYAVGARQDIAAAQRLAAFEAHYVAHQPGNSMLSDEQIQAQVLRNRQQYEKARDELSADRKYLDLQSSSFAIGMTPGLAISRGLHVSQQDEQLNMSYRNGFEAGKAAGRKEMIKSCGIALAAMLITGSTLFLFGV